MFNKGTEANYYEKNSGTCSCGFTYGNKFNMRFCFRGNK